jgi:histidine phosphotransfer protein HptB
MIDTGRIDQLREEVGTEDLAEVVALFCEEVEEVLAMLDQVATVEQLHFLKGSALNIGLSEVSAICLAEEERLRDDPQARPRVEDIRAAYFTARPALHALL